MDQPTIDPCTMGPTAPSEPQTGMAQDLAAGGDPSPPHEAAPVSPHHPVHSECLRRARVLPPQPCRPPAQAAEPPPSPTLLAVQYSFKVMAGREIVTEFGSMLSLPLGLEPACLAQTDAAFGELLRRAAVEPLEVKVRQFIQKRFEEANPEKENPVVAFNPVPSPPNDKVNLDLAEFLRQEEQRQTPPPATPFDGFPEVLPDIPGRNASR